MMNESIGLEKLRVIGGEAWRHIGWGIAAVVALVLLGIALAWSGARTSASSAQHLAIVGELQIKVRDLSALSLLAVGGDTAALTQLRERTAGFDATLAVLINGGEHKGEAVPPATDLLQTRLNDFADRWASFKRRADALLSARAPTDAQTTKDASRPRTAQQRPSVGAVPKTAPAPPGRSADIGSVAIPLLKDGMTLADVLDRIRAQLDDHQAGIPWLRYLALVCVLAAVTVLGALGVSIWRGGLALQRAAGQSQAAMFEVLRPALKTLYIDADAASLADPVLLGRRLSDEILVVIDGIKTIVKTLEAAVAEANKFAVAGHSAAQALAIAEQKEANTGATLQANVRRISAAYTALSTGATEAQQQSAQMLERFGSGTKAATDAARMADQLRDLLQSATQRYAQIVASNREMARDLLEVADLLTQAEGLALRAGNRLSTDSVSADAAVAFANDVRSYVGPSVALLKRIIELGQRVEQETGDISKALAQVASGAANQSHTAGEASRILASAETAVRELTGKISSLSRLASGAESPQLLSTVNEIVRQIAHTSASSRQVLEATKSAVNRIEDLTRVLQNFRPS